MVVRSLTQAGHTVAAGWINGQSDVSDIFVVLRMQCSPPTQWTGINCTRNLPLLNKMTHRQQTNGARN